MQPEGILGVPVHYWDIPNPAKELITKIPRYSNTSAFVFSSFGRCVCNSVPFFLAAELIAKGFKIVEVARLYHRTQQKLMEMNVWEI